MRTKLLISFILSLLLIFFTLKQYIFVDSVVSEGSISLNIPEIPIIKYDLSLPCFGVPVWNVKYYGVSLNSTIKDNGIANSLIDFSVSRNKITFFNGTAVVFCGVIDGQGSARAIFLLKGKKKSKIIYLKAGEQLIDNLYVNKILQDKVRIVDINSRKEFDLEIFTVKRNVEKKER